MSTGKAVDVGVAVGVAVAVGNAVGVWTAVAVEVGAGVQGTVAIAVSAEVADASGRETAIESSGGPVQPHSNSQMSANPSTLCTILLLAMASHLARFGRDQLCQCCASWDIACLFIAVTAYPLKRE